MLLLDWVEGRGRSERCAAVLLFARIVVGAQKGLYLVVVRPVKAFHLPNNEALQFREEAYPSNFASYLRMWEGSAKWDGLSFPRRSGCI